MSEMQNAIAALEHARYIKLTEIEAIDRAIAELQNMAGIMPTLSPHATEFAGLGIVEATQRLLAEKGEPLTTREIADALLDRGVTTHSKNFVATVYATLIKSGAVKRTKDDRWTLANAPEPVASHR